MSLPAISAEKSPLEALHAPDDQTSFAFRLDHDPNLPGLGIYQFEIEAAQLKKVLEAAVLPKWRAPFLHFEVSTSALKIIAQTEDASFSISTSAPLLQRAEIGAAPISFEVDRDVMMRIFGLVDMFGLDPPNVRGLRWWNKARLSKIFTGPLAFTFDRSASALAWTGHEGDKNYCITAHRVPTAAPEVGLRPLGVISRSVGRGIRYAATLINRKEPANFPYDGVIVEGGSILGGYHYGFSRWRSPLLPENLLLSVPKEHVANAVALCSRLAGKVEVLETASRIYLKAFNIEGSWTRINQQSAQESPTRGAASANRHS